MNKLFTLCGLLALLAFAATAKQVDVNAAKQVGQHFLAARASDNSAKRMASLTLAYTAASQARGAYMTQQTPYFYIFNSGNGFVIVAGDDAVTPILGYSTEGSFDPNNIPDNAAKWLEGYIQQIRHAINRGAEATPAVQSDWQNLLEGKPTASIAGASAVEPLVKTKWGQSPNYNALCPYDTTEKDRTVTGCVATAMAQVMKFWNHPAKGSGFHTYVHEKYGTLSANFGDATYNWASMPNEVKDANTAVATLMYHCGVSIDMSYGVGKNGGSGARTLDVVDALKKYFGYSDDIKGLYRKDFTDSAWIATLKGELDSKRPIQYAGVGTGGGHSFVCDGYDENNKFHINWGWDGSSDGYFSMDNLDPSSLGTGGGTGGFNSNQRAIIKITPAEAPVVTLRLSAPLTLSASTVSFLAPFTVTVNITNSGNTTFSGDITAAVFDNTGKYVGSVETKTGQTLAAGASFPTDLVFSTDGMKDMLPGDYVVRMYHSLTGSEWKIVEDYINFSNYAGLKVILENDLQLTAPMALNPGRFIKGESASVTVNLKNTSTTEFTGEVGVGLFDLEGELVEVIETKAGTLPAGGEAAETFSSDAIDADAGTYYIACLYQKTDSDEPEIVGATTYPNPITVTVMLPDVKPDKYENNNTPEKASALPVEFAGNEASIKTDGANCNDGVDYDFYKINLPAGSNYAFAARLHDEANSGNGNEYSLDAIFSYSTDNGATWSDAYDDLMDAPVVLPGGTSVLFYVAPYFTSETGTYLLEIGVEKGATGVDENDLANAVNLYPNPSAGEVSVDVQDIPGSIRRIEIVSLHGQTVSAFDNPAAANGVAKISASGLAGGMYAVRLHTSEGVFTKKLVVQ